MEMKIKMMMMIRKYSFSQLSDLHEKLTVTAAVQKISAFYGTLKLHNEELHNL
jgi:hypothetical protein